MIWLVIQLILGVLLLTKGADWFTRATAMITDLTGLPRLLIGAFLIGLTTNLPELAISMSAAWYEHPGIALGNPLGSNIVNTGLILGLLLVRSQITVERAWLRAHSAPMLFSAFLIYALALFGVIHWISGIILLLICGFYVFWTIQTAKREPVLAEDVIRLTEENEISGEIRGIAYRWTVVALLTVISVIAILFSSHWVLQTAVAMAALLQISETVIALSIIAFGTSLPELATVLSAAKKGHHDTSLGIIIGSNIYNLLGVIGFAALISPLPVSVANLLFDFPVMALVLCIPIIPALWGLNPGRKTGAALLIVYFAYTYSLYTLYNIFQS